VTPIIYPALSDNYGFVVSSPNASATAAVDTPDADALFRVLDEHNLELTHVFTTHHHPDHTQGNEAVKKRFPHAIFYGPALERDTIPCISHELTPGDTFKFGNSQVAVLDVSGHTLGHIAYNFVQERILFAGDSIFPLGCGRIFEGTPDQSYHGLRRIAHLPSDTLIFSAHEYAESNARFALAADPTNPALQERAKRIHDMRAAGHPTVPSTLAEELGTNPFLTLPGHLLGDNAAGMSSVERFAKLRELKDTF